MSANISIDEMERLAKHAVDSGMFGVKNVSQAIGLMLLAQAEGSHFATAFRDYNMLGTRPAMKADAMLARFQASGGVVKWLKYEDTEVSAEFSHPQSPKPLVVTWDKARAESITYKEKDDNKWKKLTEKKIWKEFMRAMLRSRVISEGVRAVCPGKMAGVYTPDEIECISEEDTGATATAEPVAVPKVQQPQPRRPEAEDAVIVSETPAPQKSEPAVPAQSAPEAPAPQPKKEEKKPDDDPIKAGTLRVLAAAMSGRKVTESDICHQFKVDCLESLKQSQANAVLDFVRGKK